MVVVGGGMQANTETSRSSARAQAATTMSITSIVATLIADLKKEENQMCNAASHACAQFL